MTLTERLKVVREALEAKLLAAHAQHGGMLDHRFDCFHPNCRWLNELLSAMTIKEPCEVCEGGTKLVERGDQRSVEDIQIPCPNSCGDGFVETPLEDVIGTVIEWIENIPTTSEVWEQRERILALVKGAEYEIREAMGATYREGTER